jgi:hypothetical protein
VKLGKWLPGKTILPELIRRDRNEYIAALRAGDESAKKGALDLSQLHSLLSALLKEQMDSVGDQKAD